MNMIGLLTRGTIADDCFQRIDWNALLAPRFRLHIEFHLPASDIDHLQRCLRRSPSGGDISRRRMCVAPNMQKMGGSWNVALLHKLDTYRKRQVAPRWSTSLSNLSMRS